MNYLNGYGVYNRSGAVIIKERIKSLMGGFLKVGGLIWQIKGSLGREGVYLEPETYFNRVLDIDEWAFNDFVTRYNMRSKK